MAITIDWATKVINIPKSYLTLISGTLFNLNTNQFRLDLRGLEATAAGMPFPRTHKHNTTIVLSGITYARTVEIINGYTIVFENGAYAANLDNSNNNILDVTVRNNVSVGANNSAGLINAPSLETAAYGGRVVVDPINGRAGTYFPIGTFGDPVDNLTDAHAISDRVGVPELFFKSSMTLNSEDWSEGHLFTSSSPILVTLTVTAGANVAGCEFRDVTVTGPLAASTVLRTCFVSNVSVGGFIFNCAIGGDVTMLGPLSLLDCWSGIPGLSHPDVNIANAGNLGVRGYYGGIGIGGCSLGTIDVSLDMLGTAHLHSDITAGTYMLRGSGILTDDSTGSPIIVKEGFIEGKHVRATHTALGLEEGNAATVTPSGLTTVLGDVDVVFTGDGVSSTTMTRQP